MDNKIIEHMDIKEINHSPQIAFIFPMSAGSISFPEPLLNITLIGDILEIRVGVGFVSLEPGENYIALLQLFNPEGMPLLDIPKSITSPTYEIPKNMIEPDFRTSFLNARIKTKFTSEGIFKIKCDLYKSLLGSKIDSKDALFNVHTGASHG